MEDECVDERIRVWSMRGVGKLASLGIDLSIKGQAKEKFLEIWFLDRTDPESALGEEVEQQLVNLASRDPSSARALIKTVRVKAEDRNPTVKARAEVLLERLKGYLLQS